jgi:hypothetical protein
MPRGEIDSYRIEARVTSRLLALVLVVVGTVIMTAASLAAGKRRGEEYLSARVNPDTDKKTNPRRRHSPLSY